MPDSRISTGKNCLLNCRLEDRELLKLIVQNPFITQKEIADQLGKSERTVRDRMAALQEKKYICRVNGKRNGWWEILVELS